MNFGKKKKTEKVFNKKVASTRQGIHEDFSAEYRNFMLTATYISNRKPT